MRGETIGVLAIFLAIVLAILGTSSGTSAACIGRTLEVFPASGATLPINGHIILAVPRHLKRPGGRTPWRTLTLRAETERVALKAMETLEGADGDMQMVLVPAAPLRPGTTYELAIADVPTPAHRRSLEELLNDSPSGHDSEVVRFAWTTARTSDRARPRWRAAPKGRAGVNEQLGCGPEVLVPVSVPIDSEEAVQILAEVTPLGGGQGPGGANTRRYLIAPQDSEIEIGHAMCGGPFDLAPGVHYSVKLTAVDVAGNWSPAPGRPLEIIGPRPSR